MLWEERVAQGSVALKTNCGVGLTIYSKIQCLRRLHVLLGFEPNM